MTDEDGARVVEQLAQAARNADRAGYEVLELHAANGYLCHQFLSPLSNRRTDHWGGSLTNRMSFPLAMVGALREGWPDRKPLLVRLPATDLLDGGLTVDEAITVAGAMARRGADMIDLESGTLIPEAPRPDEPLDNARYGPVFRAAGLPTAASGQISTAQHLAEAVPGLTDAAFIGRAALRDPYWALRMRDEPPVDCWPRQYHRAF